MYWLNNPLFLWSINASQNLKILLPDCQPIKWVLVALAQIDIDLETNQVKMMIQNLIISKRPYRQPGSEKLVASSHFLFCHGNRAYSFVNTLRLRQNGRHFADNIFKCIFLNENARISIKISLKLIPKDPINNTRALVQIMAWRRPGDKPLSEPMMVSLLTHICVTWPQCVKPCPCM